MCGRICVMAEKQQIADFFGLEHLQKDDHPMPARYNIAPTQPVLTILDGPAKREARLMKWAFLPSWVKDPGAFSLVNNARAETIETKPSFRTAIRHRRCLIPVSGFYEWQRDKATGAKQPYWIRPSSLSIMALAGIWETWVGPNGEEVDNMAIVTTSANKAMAPVHHRMPVIIPQNEITTWLDCRSGRFDEARSLMRSIDDDFLRISPVSNRVNNVANDDPALLEPVLLADQKQSVIKTDETSREDQQNQLSLF